MPVSMAIVCLIIGLTRPVRWKALECIARSARMPSVSRNEQSKLISLSDRSGSGTEELAPVSAENGVNAVAR